MIRMAMLWQDPGGRLSPLRCAALALTCLPALWIIGQASVGLLGPRPLTAAIHLSGDWSIRLLWLTLFITPLRRLMDWPGIIAVRRILGLSAFAYAFVHLVLYVADLKWDLAKATSEIFQRIYLGIGFASLVGLGVLAATSRDSAVRRLGAEGWRALHRLVFPIAVLAVVHFFIQSKLKVSEPVLMAGLLVWLTGWRTLESRRWSHAGGLLILSVLAALATMLIEVAWYGMFTGVAADRILTANFDFEFEIRMMWWDLAAGLAASALQAIRGRPLATPRNRA